jgi:hypothetical protein
VLYPLSYGRPPLSLTTADVTGSTHLHSREDAARTAGFQSTGV